MNRSSLLVAVCAAMLAACGAGTLDVAEKKPASDAGPSGGNGGGGNDAGTSSDAGSSSDDAGTATDAGTTGDDGGVITSGGDDGGTDGGTVSTGGGGTDAGTFTPISVSAAVGKVKDLLVGAVPTNDEVAAVAADHTAIKGLIDQWVALPQYDAKMRAFFATAFQQTQVTANDFTDQGADGDDARVLQSLRESFARTAQQLIAEGRPFTDVMTTRRFMLTPRLAALYAFVDTQLTDDNGKFTDTWMQAHPGFKFTVQSSNSAITPDMSLNPADPNYMVWYNPNLAKTPVYDALCPTDNIVYNNASASMAYFGLLRGQGQTFTITLSDGVTQHTCNPPSFNGAFVASDFNTWQMVSVRTPNSGETPSDPFTLAPFRSGAELVLNVPRVSFFSTPAFLATWQTNQSNQARVTMNQTLIVALGKAIDPANVTWPPSLAALDQSHIAPGSACFACHVSLDPMRQFFRQAYSLHFHQQTLTAESTMPGQFGFYGVSDTSTNGIVDLGAMLAGHPHFATAWVQKLCTYATSAQCDETDPEFNRIVSAFVGSNYSWKTLVRELFSSPLVTYLAPTQTAQAGQTFPLARRDHLCALLSTRLNLTDVCGLDVNTAIPSGLAVIKTIATVLPSDQYSRGAEGAILANDPSLVFRTGIENICAALALKLVDNGSSSPFLSTNSQKAIADMVHNLMGITGDRDASRIAILTSHFNAARATSGVTVSDALRSTFTLACLSPSVVGVGQ